MEQMEQFSSLETSITQFDPTQTRAWGALQRQAEAVAGVEISSLFNTDNRRHQKYSAHCAGIFLDYSKNLLTDEILQNLLALAEESPLREHAIAMYSGAAVNTSEGKAALHTALRATDEDLHERGLGALIPLIAKQRAKVMDFSDQIRNGDWLGITGKPIKHILNVGIGGSDLGPKLACEALEQFAHPALEFHFISGIDGLTTSKLLEKLDAEATLVIVSSKSLSTVETRLNAEIVAQWLGASLSIETPYSSPHFICITANRRQALGLGFDEERILELWDWVGGRYSLWSSIGLTVAIRIGYAGFTQMLAGARAMDVHFLTAEWGANLPVILALLGIWYGNFHGVQTQAVIPYCERLGSMPAFLQQLDMESNGKNYRLAGSPVCYPTGPVLWGRTGSNAQHSFFQFLHQGMRLAPVDFIGFLRDGGSEPEHHRILMANMCAQAAALMKGTRLANAGSQGDCRGNRPSNTLLVDELTPFNLGSLLALYEHKVFTQGSLWNINSFDQWGVELGKSLAVELLKDADGSVLDPSTLALMKKINESQ